MKSQSKPKSIRTAAAAAGVDPSAVYRMMKADPSLDAEGAAKAVANVKETRNIMLRCKARLAELDLAEREGRLIDKETVERDQRAFVQIVTNDLLTCHGTIAHLCVGKTHAEAETAVKTHIRRMLENWQKLA